MGSLIYPSLIGKSFTTPYLISKPILHVYRVPSNTSLPKYKVTVTIQKYPMIPDTIRYALTVVSNEDTIFDETGMIDMEIKEYNIENIDQGSEVEVTLTITEGEFFIQAGTSPYIVEEMTEDISLYYILNAPN